MLIIAGLCLSASIVAEGLRYGRQLIRAQAAGLDPAAAPITAHRNRAAEPQLRLRSIKDIPAAPGAPSAHASALAAWPDGELQAYWWAGTRESAPDVAIYASSWKSEQWSATRRVFTRKELSVQLGFGVRRLGNPSVWRAADGRLHLYVVATGLGGWAASRVVHLVSDDRGERFVARRTLPLSPWLNTSVLVRTQALGLADGGWLLPAYFELGNKYPMLIAFDAQGVPQWMRRIGRSVSSLQPALIALGPNQLRAWMRDNGKSGKVQQASSSDGGLTWQDDPATTLTNHDSSIAALGLAQGGFVLAHNDQAGAGGARDTPRQWLRLSTSVDGASWRGSLDVRRGERDEEFSYPAVQQVGNQLHVTYTSQRRVIGHNVYDIVQSGEPQ